MKTLLALAFLTSACLASGQSIMSTCMKSTWDPRNLMGQKGGVVVWIDAGNTNCRTNNGATISGLGNLADSTKLNLGQNVALNQPILSRTDNAGNLLKQSEDLSTSWGRVRVNAFLNTTDVNERTAGSGSFINSIEYADPFGGHNADFVQEDTTASNTHHIDAVSLVLIPSLTYVWSGFFHPVGRTNVQTVIYDTAVGTTNVVASFDLNGGVVSGVSSLGGAVLISTNITTAPNGFYLCSMTFTIPVQTTYQVVYRICSVTNSASYSGNNTDGLIIYGSSLKPNSWDSTYVSTTSVPAFPGLSGRTVLYFDGTAHYMKTLATTLNQPEEIWLGVMQWTWTAGDYWFDGNLNSTLAASQSSAGASPQFRNSAGVGDVNLLNGDLNLGVFGCVRFGYNHATSYNQVNSGSIKEGGVGDNNAGGFTLGATPTPTGYGNILFSQTIICTKTNASAEANYIGWGIKKQCKVQ